MLLAMRIEFLKMQGLGNDFFVFDAPAAANPVPLDSTTLRALADRHTGVGFDQALMLESPRDSHSRVYYRVFNADGGEVEQCGNGARCIAALLYARDPHAGRELLMDSPGGLVRARVRHDGLVSVDMGVPNFDPRALPMLCADEAPTYRLDIDGKSVEFGAVSMGNPHAVLQVPSVDAAPVDIYGTGHRASCAISETHQRRLHAASRSRTYSLACLRTRCRGNVGMRHGRLRCRCGRSSCRTARPGSAGRSTGRHGHGYLAG